MAVDQEMIKMNAYLREILEELRRLREMIEAKNKG